MKERPIIFSGSDCQERLVRPFFARVWKEGKYIEKPVCCDPMSRAFRSGSDNEGYGAVAHAWADDPKSIGFGSDLPSIRFCPWCGADTHVFDWSTSPVLPPNGPDQREFKEGGAA